MVSSRAVFSEGYFPIQALCKQCARDCISQVSAIRDASLADGVTVYMFDEDQMMSLWIEFGTNPETDIWDHEPLAKELLLYSYTSCTSIRVEGDHRTVRLEALKCGGPIKPATMCCRLRRSYTEEWLGRQAFVNFLVVNWRKHGMWHNLLGHRFEKKAIDAMTFTQKAAHVYTYNIDDQHDNDVDLREGGRGLGTEPPVFQPMAASLVNDWTQTMNTFSVKPDPISVPVHQMVIYWRNRLQPHEIYSAPQCLFERGADPSGGPGDPGDAVANTADVLALVASPAAALVDAVASLSHNGVYFFQVVGVGLKNIHLDTKRNIKPQRTLLHTVVLPGSGDLEAVNADIFMQRGSPQVIDLREWCREDRWRVALSLVRMWDVDRVTHELAAIPRSSNESCPICPAVAVPALTDDDAAVALMDTDSKCLNDTMHALVSFGAVAENNVFVQDNRLVGVRREDLLELGRRGLATRYDGELGAVSWALNVLTCADVPQFSSDD